MHPHTTRLFEYLCRMHSSVCRFEAKQKLRYTGVVYYTLKSGANFSYPIEGDMGDVSQTNAICQIGPEVPIPPMTRAAGGMAANGTAAAAAVAPEYRYAVPSEWGDVPLGKVPHLLRVASLSQPSRG